MPAATIPACEIRRLEALHSYHQLDTDTEERFDRYTRLATNLLDTPVAAISLIDANRQWFKSITGSTLRQTSRDVAFCGYTILGPHALIVNDALLDNRFSDNALVTGDPNIRFYAGAPLLTRDGLGVGALCAIDTRPRQITAQQQAGLVDIAACVMETFDLLRAADQMQALALTDPLTGLSNRMHFFNALTDAIAAMERVRQPLSLIYLDCDNFKQLNDQRGHQVGDDMLRLMGRDIMGLMRHTDTLARLGGDEFAVLLPETGPAAAHKTAERILEQLDSSVLLHGYGTTLSIGVATFLAPPRSAQGALAQADAAMYEAKNNGKNQVVALTVGGAQTVLHTIAR